MCNCIEQVNEQLTEHNAAVSYTLRWKEGDVSKVILEVFKIDPKSRKKPPRMIASFCPFCGEPYEVKASKQADNQ